MKKVGVLFANGFEEIEALTVVDVLRRAEVQCDIVTLEGKEVLGAHNIAIKGDKVIGDYLKDYDMIVLPGGMPGATNLRDNDAVIELIKYFNDNNKFIAAICAAPIVLAKAEVINNINITSYPGYEEDLKNGKYMEELVVVDGNIITSRGPATTLEFSYKLLEVLNCDKAETLKNGMMYNFLKSKIK